MTDELPTTPTTLADGRRGLAWGLTAGPLADDPVAVGPAGGHARRWLYVGAAGDDVAVGAAVVDPLPRWAPMVVTFAWAWVAGEVVTWERRLPRAWAAVGAVPDAGAHSERGLLRREHVVLGADGGLRLRVRLRDGRWARAHVATEGAEPVTLATRTPGGGWNVTQKVAGAAARGQVRLGDEEAVLDGGAWADWTAGRQDRDTAWRWAAATGRGDHGARVGLNVSTGMNGRDAGEDVVWWDGEPRPVRLRTLAPDGPAAGTWTVAGGDWSLAFHPVGVRAADEDLWLVRSRYVQPIGHFHGTLPGPDGTPRRVELVGVTEDHEARW